MLPVKKILLNLYFWPLFALVTLLFVVGIPLFSLTVLLWPGKSIASFFRRGITKYGWAVCRLIPFMAPVKLDNRAGILPSPVIYVANHLSSVDPYCFGVVDSEYGMFTSWPFQIPVFKWMMKAAQYVDTRRGWEDISRQAHKLLADGCSLIIWPEGHRSRNGRLGDFQRGAFRLAVEANCPVVPVCFINTDTLLAPGCRFLSPARVKVVLLPALWPDPSHDKRKAIKQLCHDCHQIIGQELKEQQHGEIHS
ncbi:MAG: 1-acyl-sn-glycerol-3-phosphate acyltransferase [Proteobacteria bacterium]|nr:1-acyl-sn-glycerol-3-phosphate acyltransferase [Pseudomonadota bacterium]MBU1640116.1 1-acyl-sn-glycerol-3-phosphate acyltransferase [Pseudomonadota bacterium]